MPTYDIVKDKLPLPDISVADLLAEVAKQYEGEEMSDVDGLKISFADRWVHMRPSNTEPILRVYAEAPTEAEAQELAERFKAKLSGIIGEE
jgi:phosphomannomutase